MAVAQTAGPSVLSQAGRQKRSFVFIYLSLVLLLLIVSRLARMYNAWFSLAFVVLLVVVGLSIVRPALGLGVVLTLTIVGDEFALPWWPVSKNFSSRESVLFIANALTFKPLEVILFVVLAIWFISRRLSPGAPPINYGAFGRPMAIFAASLAMGFVWGMLKGGDIRVAIYESGPLFYIPLVYLMSVNLFTSLTHYRRLMVGILGALTVEAIQVVSRLSTIRAELNDDASTVVHTAALHINIMILMFVASLWFGTNIRGKRPLLILVLIPTMWLYIDSQRRAGIVALIIGGLVLAVVLFVRNRKTFNWIIPIIMVLVLGYTGAFWNSDSQVAFPAQAIKTVIAPDDAGDKDASSDLYRAIENVNLNATIRSSPILGIGFGRPFLRPIPLADISFFEFAPFIPHNTVLWLWTKVGLAGFVSFIYMIGMGSASGIRAAVRMRDPDNASMVAVFSAYLPMFLVLAFVEISGDATTTTLFAVSLALVGSADRLAAKDEAELSGTGVTVDGEPTAVEEVTPGGGRLVVA